MVYRIGVSIEGDFSTEMRPRSVDVDLNNKPYLSKSDVSISLHRGTQNQINDPMIFLNDGSAGQAVLASISGDIISFRYRGGSKRALEGILRTLRLSIGSDGSLETSHETPSKQRDGSNDERMNQLSLRMGKIITMIIVPGSSLN